jgi:sulfur-oxidizing protein SoxX
MAITAALLWLPGSIQSVAATDDTSPDSIEPYYDWSVKNLSIATSIGVKRGKAERGRQLSVDRAKDNCVACHALPIAEAEFPGKIGPR